jgi:hypothetical protein
VIARRLLSSAVHVAWDVVQRVGDVVPGTRVGDRFGTLGVGSAIGFPMATLMNPGSIHVGRDTLVGRHVTLSVW